MLWLNKDSLKIMFAFAFAFGYVLSSKLYVLYLFVFLVEIYCKNFVVSLYLQSTIIIKMKYGSNLSSEPFNGTFHSVFDVLNLLCFRIITNFFVWFFFTIPAMWLLTQHHASTCVSLCPAHAGFEFARIMFLLRVPNLLKLLRVLRSSTALRLAKLLSVASFVVLASAGVFHLVRPATDVLWSGPEGAPSKFSWNPHLICLASHCPWFTLTVMQWCTVHVMTNDVQCDNCFCNCFCSSDLLVQLIPKNWWMMSLIRIFINNQLITNYEILHAFR